LAFCWRALFAALLLASAALNVGVDMRMREILAERGTPPLVRYERMVLAAKWWPLDRNVRWAPERYREAFNALVDQLQVSNDAARRSAGGPPDAAERLRR
jgi:hypothetical protein